MKRRRLSVLIILLAMVVLPALSDACSTFCLLRHDQPLFGRNYDWMVGDAVVIVNKRGVAKTAMGPQPARWTSTYGSVTVNQYGREMPMGGMNEAGLVVATLWLKDTEYAEPDHRPAVNALQWMQYQLDTARTVAEVIDRDTRIRVRPGSTAKLHYFVCDSTGTCASIEFLEGKQVAHTQNMMAVKALTNDAYSQSVAFWRQHEGFGGTLPLPTSLVHWIALLVRHRGLANTIPRRNSQPLTMPSRGWQTSPRDRIRIRPPSGVWSMTSTNGVFIFGR